MKTTLTLVAVLAALAGSGLAQESNSMELSTESLETGQEYVYTGTCTRTVPLDEGELTEAIYDGRLVVRIVEANGSRFVLGQELEVLDERGGDVNYPEDAPEDVRYFLDQMPKILYTFDPYWEIESVDGYDDAIRPALARRLGDDAADALALAGGAALERMAVARMKAMGRFRHSMFLEGTIEAGRTWRQSFPGLTGTTTIEVAVDSISTPSEGAMEGPVANIRMTESFEPYRWARNLGIEPRETTSTVGMLENGMARSFDVTQIERGKKTRILGELQEVRTLERG